MPAAPANTALPGIAGTLRQGAQLAVVRGGWTNTPVRYDYEWLRCTPGCSVVATGQTYTLTAADVGATLRSARDREQPRRERHGDLGAEPP